MAKTYLITLSEAELQTVVFECVDRAIKINKYFSFCKEKNIDNSKINTRNNRRNELSLNQEEVSNG